MLQKIQKNLLKLITTFIARLKVCNEKYLHFVLCYWEGCSFKYMYLTLFLNISRFYLLHAFITTVLFFCIFTTNGFLLLIYLMHEKVFFTYCM